MEPFSIHSGGCSCTGCVYRSRSKEHNVHQLLQEGSDIDKLYFGNFLPLRERQLLEKLIRTRDVYLGVRNQLLSATDQTISKHKKKRRDEDLRSDQNSAVLQMIELVDRGQIEPANVSKAKLSSCCSSCSCKTLRKIRKPLDIYKKHHKEHIHIVDFVDRGQMVSANASKPKLSSCCNCCSCETLRKIRKRMEKEDKKHPKVHRSKRKALDSSTEIVTKTAKGQRRKLKKVQSHSSELGTIAVKIRKDSLMLFREKLLKKRPYDKNKHSECKPGTCKVSTCSPEECFKKIKPKRVGDTRRRKHHNRHSEIGRHKSHISTKTRPTKVKVRESQVEIAKTKSSSSLTTILKTEYMPSLSNTEFKGKNPVSTKPVKGKHGKSAASSLTSITKLKAAQLATEGEKVDPKLKSKAKRWPVARDKDLEENVPVEVLPQSKAKTKPATKSTSSLISVAKEKATKARSKSIKTLERHEREPASPPTRHKTGRQKPRREPLQDMEETDMQDPIELVKAKKEKRLKPTHGRKQRQEYKHSKTQFAGVLPKASKHSLLRDSASQSTKPHGRNVLSKSKSQGRFALASIERLKRKSVGCAAFSQKTSSRSRTKSEQKQSKSAENFTKKSKFISKEPPPDIEENNIECFSNRQAVKLSSNFSFNIEFYKDTYPCVEVDEQPDFEPPQTPRPRRRIKQTQHRRKSKDQATGHIRSRHNMSSQSGSTQSYKSTQVVHKLKRCFCAHKLIQTKKQKLNYVESKKTMASLDTKDREVVARQIRTQTKQSGNSYVVRPSTSTQASLLPYEWELDFCTPGKCDPYECLERIKQRKRHAGNHVSRDTNTTDTPKKSKVASTSHSESKSTSSKIQSSENRKIERKQRHTQYDAYSPKVKPKVSSNGWDGTGQRQAVRIDSIFNLSVEFSKTNINDRVTTNALIYDSPNQIEKRQTRPKGIKVYKPSARHEISEITKNVKTKQTHTEPFLQRCLCTLKLLKKNKKKVEKISAWRNRDEYVMQIQTGAENGFNPERSKFLPYECEHGSCFPKECHPYDCGKLIKLRQIRLRHKYSYNDFGSRSTFSKWRDFIKLDKPYANMNRPKRKSFMSVTSDFSGSTMAKSTQPRLLKHRTKEDPKLRNIQRGMKAARSFSPSRLAVCDGSIFSFNKKKSTNRSIPSIRNTTIKNRVEKYDTVSDISTINRMKDQHSLSQENKFRKDHKASDVGLFLKKCFCRLALQKKNIPEREFHWQQPITTQFVQVEHNNKKNNRHNVTKSRCNVVNKTLSTKEPLQSKLPEDRYVFKENPIESQNGMKNTRYNDTKRGHIRSQIDVNFDKIKKILNTQKINPFYQSFYAFNVKVSKSKDVKSYGSFDYKADKKHWASVDCKKLLDERCKAEFEGKKVKTPTGPILILGSDFKIRAGVYKDTNPYKNRRQAVRIGSDARVDFDFFRELTRRNVCFKSPTPWGPIPKDKMMMEGSRKSFRRKSRQEDKQRNDEHQQKPLGIKLMMKRLSKYTAKLKRSSRSDISQRMGEMRERRDPANHKSTPRLPKRRETSQSRYVQCKECAPRQKNPARKFTDKNNVTFFSDVNCLEYAKERPQKQRASLTFRITGRGGDQVKCMTKANLIQGKGEGDVEKQYGPIEGRKTVMDCLSRLKKNKHKCMSEPKTEAKSPTICTCGAKTEAKSPTICTCGAKTEAKSPTKCLFKSGDLDKHDDLEVIRREKKRGRQLEKAERELETIMPYAFIVPEKPKDLSKCPMCKESVKKKTNLKLKVPKFCIVKVLKKIGKSSEEAQAEKEMGLIEGRKTVMDYLSRLKKNKHKCKFEPTTEAKSPTICTCGAKTEAKSPTKCLYKSGDLDKHDDHKVIRREKKRCRQLEKAERELEIIMPYSKKKFKKLESQSKLPTCSFEQNVKYGKAKQKKPKFPVRVSPPFECLCNKEARFRCLFPVCRDKAKKKFRKGKNTLKCTCMDEEIVPEKPKDIFKCPMCTESVKKKTNLKLKVPKFPSCKTPFSLKDGRVAVEWPVEKPVDNTPCLEIKLNTTDMKIINKQEVLNKIGKASKEVQAEKEKGPIEGRKTVMDYLSRLKKNKHKCMFEPTTEAKSPTKCLYKSGDLDKHDDLEVIRREKKRCRQLEKAERKLENIMPYSKKEFKKLESRSKLPTCTFEENVKAKKAKQKTPKFPVRVSPPFECLCNKEARLRRLCPVCRDKAKGKFRKGKNTLKCTCMDEEIEPEKPKDLSKFPMCKESVKKKTNLKLKVPKFPSCKTPFSLKDGRVAVQSPVEKPVDNTPCLEIKLNTTDMKIINKQEVLKKIRKASKEAQAEKEKGPIVGRKTVMDYFSRLKKNKHICIFEPTTEAKSPTICTCGAKTEAKSPTKCLFKSGDLDKHDNLEIITRAKKRCRQLEKAERELEIIMPYSKKKFKKLESQSKLPTCTFEQYVKAKKAKQKTPKFPVRVSPPFECLCNKEARLRRLCPVCRDKAKGKFIKGKNTLKCTCMDEEIVPEKPKDIFKCPMCTESVKKKTNLKLKVPKFPSCKTPFSLKDGRVAVEWPVEKPVDNTPCLEIKLNTTDMKIINKQEVLKNIRKSSKDAQAEKEKTLKLALDHGSKCKCCVCSSLKKGKALAGIPIALKPQAVTQPCVCGSKECKKDWDKIKQEQAALAAMASKLRKCVYGSTICELESSKMPDILLEEARQAETVKELTKIAEAKEKAYQEARLKRKNKYEKERELEEELRKKHDIAKMKSIKKNNGAGDFHLLAESLVDFGTFISKAFCDVATAIFRSVSYPRDAINDIRDASSDPGACIKHFRRNVAHAGLRETNKRIKTRFAKMPTVKRVCKALRSSKDPNNGMFKKSKRSREPVEFECSLYMSSMRKRPCLSVYYMFPWFYPHCVSLLGLWKRFLNILLFILAAAVWSPCIMCMELCRVFVCCVMGPG